MFSYHYNNFNDYRIRLDYLNKTFLEFCYENVKIEGKILNPTDVVYISSTINKRKPTCSIYLTFLTDTINNLKYDRGEEYIRKHYYGSNVKFICENCYKVTYNIPKKLYRDWFEQQIIFNNRKKEYKFIKQN